MAYISFQPNDYFNTKLYAGNNTADTAITGIGFQPDFVWLKNRDNGTGSHALFDVVRGVSKRIKTDDTSVEATASGVSAFDSDGFTLGTSWNQASTNFVSWNWKAGGAGSTNNDGSVASTVSANTTAGISIVKWSSTQSALSVGHGLGVAPKVIIQKALGVAANMVAGGFGLSWNGYIMPSSTNAFNDSGDASTGTGRFFKAGGTEPTSTVFHTNSSALIGSASDMIAYCFAEKKGFSKFGFYTGNGSSTLAPFVYTGFKPALVIGKNTDVAGQHWFMNDNKRGVNGGSNWLKVDGSDAELTNLVNCDFLSNGFKLRNDNDIFNDNGAKFIYMAFAEEPLVASNGTPATAR